jgi:hypothetical protein
MGFTYSSEDFRLIFVVADFEQKTVWHVSLVWNRKPQFQMLYFLLIGLLINFNTSLKADGIDLILSEFMDPWDVECLIFSTEPAEIHI